MALDTVFATRTTTVENVSRFLVETSTVRGEIWIRNMTNPKEVIEQPSKEKLEGLSRAELTKVALNKLESCGRKIVSTELKYENETFQAISVYVMTCAAGSPVN